MSNKKFIKLSLSIFNSIAKLFGTIKSFSVIEVLIVLTIVSTLGMVVVPQLWISEQQIRGETFINNVNLIITSLETYKKQNNVYPIRLEELENYFSDPPINSYTRSTMLISDETKAGIRYTVSPDRLSYTIEIVQKDITDLNRNGDKNETIAEALQRAVSWTTPVQIIPTSTTTYPVIIIANIPSAGSPSALPNPATVGTTVILQANANTCYTLVSWTSQNVQIQGNNFIMPSATVTIVANYNIRKYTINASAGSGGTISPNGAVSVNCGSNQTFTIVPNTGYSVSNVVVDGTSIGATTNYTFTNVTTDHTISASFSAIQYSISFNVNPIGAGSPSASPNPAAYGQTVTLTANPSSCYTFSNWSSSDVAISSNTFAMPAKNVLITANYNIKTYTINASAGSGGTINPSGAVSVNCGSNKTFNIVPNTGYAVSNVVVDGTSIGATTSYTFTNVTTGHTISASFSAIQYNISFVVNPTGAGSPTASPNPATYGQTVTLSANPGACYNFSSWSSSDATLASTTASVTTFTMPANDVTATANYKIKTYKINASAGTGGSISPSGQTTVDCGGTITYTITPSAGYVIDSVIVDGINVGATSSYTFSNVTSNRTIVANFRRTQGLNYKAGNSTFPGFTIYDACPASANNMNYAENNMSVFQTGITADYTVSFITGQRAIQIETGYINIPVSGTYIFTIGADDNADLFINGQLVAWDYHKCDGFGNLSPNYGSNSIYLSAGKYSVKIRLYNIGGPAGISINYSVNGSAATAVPVTWFTTN